MPSDDRQGRMLFDAPSFVVPPKPRNRRKERAGKSDKSWIKHKLLRGAVGTQLGKFRFANPCARILLIDGNAGDGCGVVLPQADFFDENLSRTTAQTLCEFAHKDGNADVLLCERDPEKRALLARTFPDARIISDHARAPDLIAGYSYALWLSDPCGEADRGIQHMRRVADSVRSDFVMSFNEGWLIERLQNVREGTKGWSTSQERYLPRLEPSWWTTALARRHLARNARLKQSQNYKFRALIVANHLGERVTRPPFEVVI